MVLIKVKIYLDSSFYSFEIISDTSLQTCSLPYLPPRASIKHAHIHMFSSLSVCLSFSPFWPSPNSYCLFQKLFESLEKNCNWPYISIRSPFTIFLATKWCSKYGTAWSLFGRPWIKFLFLRTIRWLLNNCRLSLSSLIWQSRSYQWPDHFRLIFCQSHCIWCSGHSG